MLLSSRKLIAAPFNTTYSECVLGFGSDVSFCARTVSPSVPKRRFVGMMNYPVYNILRTIIASREVFYEVAP